MQLACGVPFRHLNRFHCRQNFEPHVPTQYTHHTPHHITPHNTHHTHTQCIPHTSHNTHHTSHTLHTTHITQYTPHTHITHTAYTNLPQPGGKTAIRPFRAHVRANAQVDKQASGCSFLHEQREIASVGEVEPVPFVQRIAVVSAIARGSHNGL